MSTQTRGARAEGRESASTCGGQGGAEDWETTGRGLPRSGKSDREELSFNLKPSDSSGKTSTTPLALPLTPAVRKPRALLFFLNLLYWHEQLCADRSEGTSHPTISKGRKADVRTLLSDFWYLPARSSTQKRPGSPRYRRRSDDNFDSNILGIKEYLPQPSGPETKVS